MLRRLRRIDYQGHRVPISHLLGRAAEGFLL
jgi:hypothetical protein